MNYIKSLSAFLLAALALQPLQTCSMQKYAKATAIAAGLGAAGYTAQYLHEKQIHFIDWNTIDPTHISVYQSDKGLDFGQWPHKEPFHHFTIADFYKAHARYVAQFPTQNEWLWGAGSAAHQNESCNTNTQWNLFEAKEKDENGNWIAPIIDGKPALLEGNVVGPVEMGCDLQNHEDEDIKLMKEFGLNAFRFSIAWEKIYPQQGAINYDELARYKRFCQKLVANGIKPVVTLYHYAEPIWFYKLGSFEKKENIQHFVEFCTTVYKELHNEVYLWFTFNAPEGIALQGWYTGSKPPAKTGDMRLAAQVLYHILEAHVAVYRAIKDLPEIGAKSQVGILKNIMQLDPLNFFDFRCHLGCHFGRELADECIYRFFNTGEFTVKVPRVKNTIEIWGKKIPSSLEWVMPTQTNEYLKNGGKALDFIGLNYYSHNYVNGKFKTVPQSNHDIEPATNNERYTIYGEGICRALEELSLRIAKPLNVPIYITENGVATNDDKQGNALRTLHNQRIFYGMALAIKNGCDVRGYIHWALMDNYEWGTYRKFYGLYHVDRNTPALKRSPKEGAKYYQSVVLGSRIEPKNNTLRARL